MMRMTYILIPRSFQLYMPVYARLFICSALSIYVCVGNMMVSLGWLLRVTCRMYGSSWDVIVKYNNIDILLGACKRTSCWVHVTLELLGASMCKVDTIFFVFEKSRLSVRVQCWQVKQTWCVGRIYKLLSSSPSFRLNIVSGIAWHHLWHRQTYACR